MEIKEEKPHYDFGVDYLWLIGNRLKAAMKDVTLKGEEWRKLDRILRSEYI